MARSALLLLFLTTDYVRPQGLGAVLAEQFSPVAARRLLALVAIVTLFFLPLDIWGGLWLGLVIVFVLVRRAALQRLGGFTGDVAGALVELVECALLLVLASRVVV